MKIFRMSGLPLDSADVEAYQAEFKLKYDELAAAAGLDMLKLHESIIEMEEKLKRQYNIIGEQALPKSIKGFQQLVDKYGAPIIVARENGNTNELVLCVCDTPIG